MRVLVPRGGDWGREAAAALVRAGFDPLVVPLLRIEFAETPEVRDALDRLAAGRFDWLVVTSGAVAPVLPSVPASVRVAAVGAGTARALAAHGVRVDVVPARQSAAGLVAEWPDRGGAALWLRAAAARPTVADGLRALGVAVTDVVAYRSVPQFADVTALDAALHLDGRSGAAPPEALLVTSGSVARQLARVRLARGTRVIAIGPQTADDCRELGLDVDAVAAAPSIDGFVDALRDLGD